MIRGPLNPFLFHNRSFPLAPISAPQRLFSVYVSRSAVRPRHPPGWQLHNLPIATTHRLSAAPGAAADTRNTRAAFGADGRSLARSLGMNNCESSNLCTRGWNGNL